MFDARSRARSQVRSRNGGFPALLLAVTIAAAIATGSRALASGRLAQVADDALVTVERIRGARLARDVARKVSALTDVREYLVRRIRAEFPPSLLALEDVRYHRMGLLRADQPLEATLLAALSANIAGFYDPDTSALHIADGTTGALLRPVLVHEWTHALQHDRVDIGRLMRRVVGNGDYGAAVVALLEGEAMAVSLAADLPAAETRPLAERLASAPAAIDGPGFASAMPGMPAVLVEELRFAYGAGLSAVLTAHARGGWPAVERWESERPPLSTEHVLHPERALGETPDCPQTLALPDLAAVLPAGARVSETETLGEAGWRTFLRVHADRTVADAAAAGWDGDVYCAVSLGGGEPSLLLVSEWDSEADAEELVRAARGLAQRAPALAAARWERRGTRVAAWFGDEAPPDGLLSTLLGKTRAREVCDHRVLEALRRPARPGEAVPPAAPPR